MDIDTFNAANNHFDNIISLCDALGIDEYIWDMDEERIRKHRLDTNSSNLKNVLLQCGSKISEIIQDKLIEELTAFKNL